MNNLEKYWPVENNLNEVCSLEAENMPEAILLAIHEKMNFQKIDPFNQKREVVSEDFFLKDFCNQKIN